MWLFAVKSDGVRCAMSCICGLSTIATLIEPPRFDPPSLSPPPHPLMSPPPITNRVAIEVMRAIRVRISLLLMWERFEAMLTHRRAGRNALDATEQRREELHLGGQLDVLERAEQHEDRVVQGFGLLGVGRVAGVVEVLLRVADGQPDLGHARARGPQDL